MKTVFAIFFLWWGYSKLPASKRSIALSAIRKIESVVVEAGDRLGNVIK